MYSTLDKRFEKSCHKKMSFTSINFNSNDPNKKLVKLSVLGFVHFLCCSVKFTKLRVLKPIIIYVCYIFSLYGILQLKHFCVFTVY